MIHFVAFSEYETGNIGINVNTWNVSNSYPLTFQESLGMMLLDTIWIALLSWYLSNVWPSEFGTHLPWYFVFDPRYWWGSIKYCAGIKNYANNSRVFDENAIKEEVPIEVVRYVDRHVEVPIEKVTIKEVPVPVEVTNAIYRFECKIFEQVMTNGWAVAVCEVAAGFGN